MCRIFAAVLALLAMVGTAHAEAGGVYTGTLGPSAVVVQFYTDQQGFVGRYFYRARGVDIGLVHRSGGRFVECALQGGGDTPQPCSKPTGYWTLAFSGDSATGTWRKTPQAPPLEIKLMLTVTRQSDASVLAQAYARLRAEGPAEPAGEQSVSSDGGVAWQFLREKRSGARIPQLTKAPDAAAMQAINKSLDETFRLDIDQALSAKPEGEYACNYKVPFANQRLFVVEEECAGFSPGAAHPSGSWNSTTYDLATGKPVDWSGVLRYPDDIAEPLDYAHGDDIVSLALRRAEHDDDCFGAAFQQLCTDNGCSNGGDWKGVLILSPHKHGLFAAFDVYPEVARSCRGQGVTFRWDEVRPLLLTPRPLP